ncbi:transposase [Streptomyces sp. NPDC047990]|uniref:transposase n=1 Tax=Streptomyces sp. NPDC047990 TaxID=3365496 RepID=UPI00371D1784
MDVGTRRTIDLMPDQKADTSAARLAEQPGIEIVCRDRTPFFAKGATRGAPQAMQVADRWHLWHNLGKVAETCGYRHTRCLRPAPAPPDQAPQDAEPAASSPWPTGHRFAERTRAKPAVHGEHRSCIHPAQSTGSGGRPRPTGGSVQQEVPNPNRLRG